MVLLISQGLELRKIDLSLQSNELMTVKSSLTDERVHHVRLFVFILFILMYFYAPALKKLGYTGLRLSVRPSLSSVLPLNHLFGENFSSKISQQPSKLECLYLVCRLMTTCCIVELRTSLLLLIPSFICPIFFPSIL